MPNFRNVTAMHKTDESKHIFLMFFMEGGGEGFTDKRIVYFVKMDNVIFSHHEINTTINQLNRHSIYSYFLCVCGKNT